MDNLLINPPAYAYLKTMDISEYPMGLLRLSSFLKSQGEEVRLFDFIPCKSFRFPYNRLDRSDNFNIIRWDEGYERFRYLKSFKEQVNPSHRNSFQFLTGEYISRFGDIFPRIYVGAEKHIFTEYLLTKKPDKIWITGGLTYTYRGTSEVIDICKEIYPDVEVVLGGIYPTLCPDHARSNTRADVIVEGDCSDFCTSPIDYDILPNDPEYLVRQFSKGCPNKCKFCSVSRLEGTKVRSVDIDRDIAEIDFFTTKYNINRVRVWSSNALIPEGGKLFDRWLDGIASLNKNLLISFPEGFAPELISKSICKKMLRAGITHINIPLEDVSDGIRGGSIGKKYNTNQWEVAIKEACLAGFRKDQILVPIMLGLPGQTGNNLMEAIKILSKHGVRGVGYPYTPVPGSEWFEASDRYKNMDLEHLYGALLPAITDPESYDQIRNLSSYIMDDMSCGFNSRRVDFLNNINKEGGKVIGGELIDKIAALIIDIAEQNEEILTKINSIKEENLEIKERINKLEKLK